MQNPNIEPPQLHIAEKVLLDAAQTVRARLKEHGHTERSFSLIGDLWTNYIRHTFTIRGNTRIYAHDVAQMMALLKMARTVYGTSEDHLRDGAGYLALTAMLNGDVYEKQKRQDEQQDKLDGEGVKEQRNGE